MIPQVPIALAAPLAVWLALDGTISTTTRRRCCLVIAGLLAINFVWDIYTYRDWAPYDETEYPADAIVLHIIASAVLGLLWGLAMVLRGGWLRGTTAALTVPTVLVTPYAATLSGIVQHRTMYAVLYATLVFLPAAGLFVVLLGRRQLDVGEARLADVTKGDLIAGFVIAFFAGLATLGAGEAVAMITGDGQFELAYLWPFALPALMWVCAATWIHGSPQNSTVAASRSAIAAAAAMPFLIMLSLIALMASGQGS